MCGPSQPSIQRGCVLQAKLLSVGQGGILSPADVQRYHSGDPDGFSMA